MASKQECVSCAVLSDRCSIYLALPCVALQVCPYYLSREPSVLRDAQLILMPYNYLIDPASRRGIDIPWENSTLIFDEAHNLDDDVLEQIRLLSNLETTRQKLIQIILIGQPELDDKLDRDDESRDLLDESFDELERVVERGGAAFPPV